MDEPEVKHLSSVSTDAGKSFVTTTVTTTKEVQIHTGHGTSVDLEDDVTTYSMTTTAVLTTDDTASNHEITIVPALLSSYSTDL